MPFRVPLLLEVVDAVVHRLDITATRALNPVGPASSGYDDIFREPVVTDTTAGASVSGRVSSRQEQTAIRVPCQVETTLFEELRQAFTGNLSQTRMALVFHRQDLANLGLLDVVTNNILLKKGDRVSQLERRSLAIPVLVFQAPGLFVTEVYPASWGFGPDGHDLHLCILERRDEGIA
jgi:hypothetical protein